jgi:hypothetical protein
LQQLQELLLLLLVSHLPLTLQVHIAFVLQVVAEDLNEPELRVVLHEAEVEFGEGLHLLIDVAANVAGEPEDLGQQGVNLDLDVPALEDLMAGLECTLVRGDKNDIDLFIPEHVPGLLALFLPLLRDPAVDVLLGVCDCIVEVLDLHALVPGEVVQLVDGLVADEALVEIGLGVPNDDQLGWGTRWLYLFDHFI